jgi:hypothetical protein
MLGLQLVLAPLFSGPRLLSVATLLIIRPLTRGHTMEGDRPMNHSAFLQVPYEAFAAHGPNNWAAFKSSVIPKVHFSFPCLQVTCPKVSKGAHSRPSETLLLLSSLLPLRYTNLTLSAECYSHSHLRGGEHNNQANYSLQRSRRTRLRSLRALYLVESKSVLKQRYLEDSGEA